MRALRLENLKFRGAVKKNISESRSPENLVSNRFSRRVYFEQCVLLYGDDAILVDRSSLEPQTPRIKLTN